MPKLKKRKIKVAVFMGGPSSEYEVSLWTGNNVIKYLDKNKYEALPVVVSKDGKWPLPLKEIAAHCDLAFIAMHGEYGEDGQIQSLCQKYGLPYTGSSSTASRLAIDKARFNALLAKNNIQVPPAVVVTKKTINLKKLENIGLPLVVKPAACGSSVGVSIVRSAGRLAPAIASAFRRGSKVLVEKYIPGRELTCGVIEKGRRLMPLPPTEIIPKTSRFFDFKAKYTPKASLEITPARLPRKLLRQVQQTALKVYKIGRCSGYARVDMILGEDNNLYVLEINTLPGLTKTSLLPQAAKKAGITFSQLLDIIISNAKKH